MSNTLTAEEQEQYAEKNIGLVHHICKKYYNTGIEYEELFGNAMIGYTKAIQTFDVSKGFKFATYASMCIGNSLNMLIRKDKRQIKGVSLDAPVQGLGNEKITIADVIAAPEKDNTIREVQDVLNEVVDKLPERTVVIMKMFLEGKKQQAIGEQLGISQTYVSRIINKVVQSVKKEYWKREKMMLTQKPKKVVVNMKLSKEEYNDYKASGKTDKEIADIKGMSVAGVSYYKKKWSTKEVKTRTPKLILAEGESSPSVHEDLVSDLSKKLRKSEAANEKQADEIARLEFELGGVKKENQDKDIEITLLKQTNDNLKKEIQDLHHAAEDAENEAAASQEYIEREQELMVDANVWKHQAELYKNENDRLNETLSEVRKELKKSQGVEILAKAFIKAVL